jgi:hypothetical protein
MGRKSSPEPMTLSLVRSTVSPLAWFAATIAVSPLSLAQTDPDLSSSGAGTGTPPTASFPLETGATGPVAPPTISQANAPQNAPAAQASSTIPATAAQNAPGNSTAPASQAGAYEATNTPSPRNEYTLPPREDRNSDEQDSDLLRVGPVVGVGLPNLLNFGGMIKLTRYLAAGVNVGLIPSTQITFYGDATLSYQEYDVYGRIHPFAGGFFLGAGIGYATIRGSLKETFDTTPYQSQIPSSIALPNPLTYESNGSVKTMVVTPQIGYFYTTDVGFSIGLDLGAQLPIAPSDIEYESKISVPANTPQIVVDQIQTKYLDPSDKKVKDTLETIGRTPVPTVNFKIGWLF